MIIITTLLEDNLLTLLQRNFYGNVKKKHRKILGLSRTTVFRRQTS